MNFNICIIQPEGYIHSMAFLELAELIHYSLIEIGHKSCISLNKIEHKARNLIVGVHLLDTKEIPQIPIDTVILNTEQVFSDQTNWNSNIFAWAKKFETWDYSDRNIIKLEEIGAPKVKLLNIGYQQELRRILNSDTKEIDVLFYGSINDRRRKIINELSKSGVKVKAVFGIYGKNRDELISKSKIVLNLHHYKSEIFEIVRVFYLLTNSKAVVGEVNATTSVDNHIKSGILPAKYEELVSTCLELLGSQSKIKALEEVAHNSIIQFPQKIFTSKLLDS
jgi:hypothetical protein